MAFPNAKATCYDAGVHVPLAICWGDKIKRKNTSEIVSSVDFAPTMLDAAGINRSSYGHMSGKSMLPFLMENKEQKREAVYFGRERHSSSRYANLGYPIRSLRKGNYLYIRNFHPERWPAGDPTPLDKNNNLAKAHSGYFDIDGSPTKQFLLITGRMAMVYNISSVLSVSDLMRSYITLRMIPVVLIIVLKTRI